LTTRAIVGHGARDRERFAQGRAAMQTRSWMLELRSRSTLAMIACASIAIEWLDREQSVRRGRSLLRAKRLEGASLLMRVMPAVCDRYCAQSRRDHAPSTALTNHAHRRGARGRNEAADASIAGDRDGCCA
jgi:hypothetical protein